jgi:competence ComEA-like helix-hairpin-helix protein
MLRYLFLFSTFLSHLFATVDLNNATADELLSLNGIGKAKSQKIIEYRAQNHCFTSIDELATIEGISKKVVAANRANLILGVCGYTQEKQTLSEKKQFLEVLLDPVNIFFTFIILLLGFLDYKTGKDLKSQIVSMGVLGTFVGIFIGLQAFNPDDIVNSVNGILVGLKTAFFTSIVGMSVSTILAIMQKFTSVRVEDE